MSEITDFGLIVLAVSATVFVALLGMRLADRISLPYAAVTLVGAVVVSEIFDDADFSYRHPRGERFRVAVEAMR